MHVSDRKLLLILAHHPPILAYADTLMNYSGAACVRLLDQC